ncbi:hypothetical protein LCGC14_0993430 [marine sediment metagenome]|uniref:Terminase large subunit gp17-like C-terminal domain-containing protein n=1 Tax=marine sediment metagenome TaxID=412755 RepID=A0A0F9N9R4_9ZZZZ
METAVDIVGEFEETAQRKQDLSDLAKECMFDSAKFAKAYMPEQFSAPFSQKLHIPILNRLDDVSTNCEVILAPRRIGKTSMTKSLALRHICFGHSNFVVYIQKSWQLAEMQTENWRRELIMNKRLRETFGSPKVKKYDGFDESFSKSSWVAWDTLVLPRGMQQPIRGLLFGYYRPTLIIVDDAEDMKTITNELLRNQNEDWMLTDVALCTPGDHKRWKIVYTDTLKHEDAVPSRLAKREDWRGLTLEMWDDDLNSNAPEFMSNEDIKAALSAHRSAGTLDFLYREMRNEVIAGEAAAFRGTYFHYYNSGKEGEEQKTEVELNGPEYENMILVDPAKTSNVSSAYTAIVGVAACYAENKHYVRDVDANRMHADEIPVRAFDMAERLHAKVIGVEKTGLDEHITYPFTNEMLRRGRSYELVWLAARRGEGEYSARGRGKEGRIASLVQFYRMGQIYHNKFCCDVLEQQLLSFPRSARWDVMDALGYLPQLLSRGERFFWNTEFSSVEGTKEEVEEEFSRLEASMSPMESLGDWRWA